MNPEILTHPNIPKPLHGIAPRVIMGKEWWDKQRQIAYQNANFCCEACGVRKEDAKYHKWLEAHEFYEYDYENGKIVFKKLVALCHSCHNFIHDGRMQILVQKGEMDELKVQDIILHGTKILHENGLYEKWEKRHDVKYLAVWKDFRLVFDGKEYGPSTQNIEEWKAGKWKNWKPDKEKP